MPVLQVLLITALGLVLALDRFALLGEDARKHLNNVSLWTKLKQYMGLLSRKMNLKKLFAPSTSGAIAGFVVGLIPQIRKSVIGDAAPPYVVQDTASLLGFICSDHNTVVWSWTLSEGLMHWLQHHLQYGQHSSCGLYPDHYFLISLEGKRQTPCGFYTLCEQPGSSTENTRKIFFGDMSFPEQKSDGGSEGGGNWGC